MNKINIGIEIRKVADSQRIRPSELARKLGKTKSTVSDIFTRKEVDTDLLYQLSVILKFDFFGLYSAQLKAKEGVGQGSNEDDQLLKRLELYEKNSALQNKYIKMLEEKVTTVKPSSKKK